MAWAKSNDVEVSSLVKAKTFGSWKDVFVGRDDGRRGKNLVVNKLKGRVLNMEKSQHEGFGKSGADIVENNNGDDKGQGDI